MSAQAPDFAQLFASRQAADQTAREAPASFAAGAHFWATVRTSSALSERMQELVLVALHGTVSSLNAEPLRRQIPSALAAGASPRDVLDVLFTVVGVANHALYFAVPVLQRELDAMDHPQRDCPPMSDHAEQIKQEFIRRRGVWNAQRDVIARMMPEYFEALSDLTLEPWAQGSLDPKERELICIAIDCTVTHMYEPGLALHIRQALRQGASREEILAVFQLAASTGLEGYLQGAQVLFGDRANR
jgi:alkylhydroperoxidase/carboxymuconolactone decarboxylase family protein YurZ